MPNAPVSIRKARGALTIRNSSLSLHLTRSSRNQPAAASLEIDGIGSSGKTPPLKLDLWTGFAAVTGHVTDYFHVTEPTRTGTPSA